MMTHTIRSIVCILIFVVSALSARCQDTTTVQAQFPGGTEALKKYLVDSLHWRQEQFTVAGSVFVSFFVTEEGELKEVRIAKSLNANCDSAAVRLVRKMPHWIPAKEKGKVVSSKVVIPVRFEL